MSKCVQTFDWLCIIFVCGHQKVWLQQKRNKNNTFHLLTSCLNWLTLLCGLIKKMSCDGRVGLTVWKPDVTLEVHWTLSPAILGLSLKLINAAYVSRVNGAPKAASRRRPQNTDHLCVHSQASWVKRSHRGNDDPLCSSTWWSDRFPLTECG